MRLPRVRFTVRRVMIAVASVAAISGAFVLQKRSAEYWEQARWHAAQEERFSPGHEDTTGGFPPSARSLSHERKAHLTGLHGRMKIKYTRAAYRPWESVEPDPPLSEFFEWDQ